MGINHIKFDLTPDYSCSMRVKIHTHLIHTNYEVVHTNLNAYQTVSIGHQSEFDDLILLPWNTLVPEFTFSEISQTLGGSV